MDFPIIYLPPFTAATSGPVDPASGFSAGGVFEKFDAYFSAVKLSPRDSFTPRDFLFFNQEANGLEWWWALAEGLPDGGFEKVDFDGGYYVVYTYRDHDGEANDRLRQEAMQYIRDSGFLEVDERPGHYSMGHIITPPEIIEAQGFALMEAFIPIKIK